MQLSQILNGTADVQEGIAQKPRRFLAYARVSTDDQERAGLSIPAQVSEMKLYAEKQKIVIADTYSEADSAFSSESRRPEFWKMVERAKQDPEISGILVHDFSRFFRDPYLGPRVKGDLKEHGVRVISVSEPEYDPDTIAGLAIEKMTEFKNASFSLDVAFHTRKGMKANVARRDHEIGYCYKNGGAPLWGLKAYKVQRGLDKRGAPIMKTLWKLDDTVIEGKPVWQWTEHILLDLRLNQHLSLDRIRDFLNEKGIPSPRTGVWSTSSIYALMQQSALLQYAGYGVWNVHGKRGKKRPASDWVTVENAHPALITMEQAEAIDEVNRRNSQIFHDKSEGRVAQARSNGSRFLLSGGLFVCSRCGANMVGFTNRQRLYYVCGAYTYRKGLGCGPGFQVSKDAIEEAVIDEVGNLFNAWSDPNRLRRLINEELESQSRGNGTETEKIKTELAGIDTEIENVRCAIKAGLDDVEWANSELRRLKAEKSDLQTRLSRISDSSAPKQVDLGTVEHLRKAFSDVFSYGTRTEKRQFARLFVKSIELNPNSGEIDMHLFSRPPAMMPKRKTPASEKAGVPFGLVAGAGFEPATFGL